MKINLFKKKLLNCFKYNEHNFKLTYFFYFKLFLVGSLFVDQSIPKDMKAVEKDLSVQYGGTVLEGGHWAPTTCVPRKKVN